MCCLVGMSVTWGSKVQQGSLKGDSNFQGAVRMDEIEAKWTSHSERAGHRPGASTSPVRILFAVHFLLPGVGLFSSESWAWAGGVSMILCGQGKDAFGRKSGGGSRQGQTGSEG